MTWMSRQGGWPGFWTVVTGTTAAGFFSGCQLLEAPQIIYPPPPPVCCRSLPEPTICAPPPDSAVGNDVAALGPPQLIDLPTALRLADAQNPEIALARERIREALAVQDRYELLWLPHLEYGPAWMRHDGQIQRATGEVLTVSRSSLFIGGGSSLSVDVSEALFGPLVARQWTVARRAGAAGVTNERLLDVAVTYIDLLEAYALIQVNEETLQHARHMLQMTEDFEAVGKGHRADTARARTEASLRETERVDLEGRVALISARLAQLLQLPPDTILRPLEPALVPIAVVPESIPLSELIVQGLTHRPELAENRALVTAALERWRLAKVAPLVPGLRLTFAAGGFGGGPNNFFGDFNGRSDFTAMAVWRLNNLGFGDRALQHERESQFTQAVFRQHSVEANITAQVVASFANAFTRRREFDAAQRAVVAARESYRLNEERIRRFPEQARPIELLQALQALARARQEYVQVVAAYNRAQFRLYTALGNPPLCALENARRLAISEPTVPAQTPEVAPQPKPLPEKDRHEDKKGDTPSAAG